MMQTLSLAIPWLAVHRSETSHTPRSEEALGQRGEGRKAPRIRVCTRIEFPQVMDRAVAWTCWRLLAPCFVTNRASTADLPGPSNY